MNSCPAYIEQLARAAEVPPGEPVESSVAEHLETCAGCRAALEAQRAVRTMLMARPALAASPAMRVRVREAVERERGLIGGVDFRRWTWRLVPIAAALALVTALGVTRADTDTSTATELSDLPVSAALYASDVSDTSALSLLLRADADAQLAAYVTAESR